MTGLDSGPDSSSGPSASATSTSDFSSDAVALALTEGVVLQKGVQWLIMVLP